MTSYILKIELPDESQQDLSAILDGLRLRDADTETAIGTAIGAALSTEALLLQELAQGSRIVIVTKEGTEHELMLAARGETDNAGRTDYPR